MFASDLSKIVLYYDHFNVNDGKAITETIFMALLPKSILNTVFSRNKLQTKYY